MTEASPAIGHVDRLMRYPVASLGGEGLDRIRIAPGGMPGDRSHGVVDAETGSVAAPEKQKRWRPAPDLSARRLADGTVEIRLPESGWLAATGSAARAALEAHFGFPAEIRPFGPDPETEKAAIPRYQRADLHILTTASLAALARLLPQSGVDPRRFRPNLLIATVPGIEGFAEGAWTGRRIAVGGAVLTIVEPCKRCAFTVLAQRARDGAAALPLDPAILATLTRENAANFGALARVEVPGPVAAGDPVRLLDG